MARQRLELHRTEPASVNAHKVSVLLLGTARTKRGFPSCCLLIENEQGSRSQWISKGDEVEVGADCFIVRSIDRAAPARVVLSRR